MNLYPLICIPQYKTNLWGGSYFYTKFGRTDAPQTSCGESWEISGVPNNLSIVQNGFLANNSLEELIEIYMDELVGQSVYEKFGIQFPLLCKFIDSQDMLSVQVHPNDVLAKERHASFGKTEMWYVVDAEENAELILGFSQEMTRDAFLECVQTNSIEAVLHRVPVSKGDVFYIPAGLVHAIGKGLVIAEIQQTSDCTYRIHDWNRVDADGNPREMHLDLALDAIDFSLAPSKKIQYAFSETKMAKLVASPFFTTNIIESDSRLEKDYYMIDSFVVYMCVEGQAQILSEHNEPVSIKAGQTLLLPSSVHQITIEPSPSVRLLEVYL